MRVEYYNCINAIEFQHLGGALRWFCRGPRRRIESQGVVVTCGSFGSTESRPGASHSVFRPTEERGSLSAGAAAAVRFHVTFFSFCSRAFSFS